MSLFSPLMSCGGDRCDFQSDRRVFASQVRAANSAGMGTGTGRRIQRGKLGGEK